MIDYFLFVFFKLKYATSTKVAYPQGILNLFLTLALEFVIVKKVRNN
jgi:hypothetical protein